MGDTKLVTQEIKQVLKTLLKKQKRTYQELADYVGVSLATIKRIMTFEDIGLERLLKILQFLEIDLADLNQLVGMNKANKIEPYTKEQEEFFVKNLNYFSYFNLLINGKTPDEIASLYGLKTLSTEKYLLKLEQLELIKKSTVGKITVPIKKNLRPGGVLHKAHLKHITSKLANFFVEGSIKVSENGNPGDRLMLHYAEHNMSNESFQKFNVDQKNIRYNYSSQSKLEEQLNEPKDLGRLYYVTWYLYDRPTDSQNLPPVDLYGDIKNI